MQNIPYLADHAVVTGGVVVGDFEQMKAAREREATRKRMEHMKQEMKRNEQAAAVTRKAQQESAYGIATQCAEILDVVVKDLKRQNLLTEEARMKLGAIGGLAMHELKRQTPKKREQ